MKRVLSLSCLLLLLLAPAVRGQTPTNERVMEIVKRTVGTSGNSIVVLGSWVSGKKYGDPLRGGASDHDMRLLLPTGTERDEAIKQWKAARQALVAEMRKEFGADAGKVLATVNLYPPTQLMTGVEDPTDALNAYRRLGVSPKLSYTGPAASIPADAAEGLYGAGANTWTQRYEKTAGKLVYKEGGAVYAGMTDLTHLSEGPGVYTSGGMANTARQWAEHAEEAVQSRQGDKVAKYLERLERDIMKARDLQRFDIHGAARDELHTLMQQLRAHPEQLGELESRVHSVLQRSKLESAVLARFERAGLAQKAVLGTLINALDTQTALAQALRDAVEKVPADKLVAGITAFIAIREMSAAAGEGDPGKLLVGAAPWLLPLGPAILTHIAQATIDAAKDAGFALMANSQEPFDLLAGIYTAGGRPDPNGTKYTLDQLVAAYSDEAKLKSFVYALARRAADRNAGTATAAADMQVADAIMARCFPVILRAWRAKREALTAEYLDLSDILREAAPRLRYRPVPARCEAATGKALVTVTAGSSDPKFAAHRERMLEILRILHGPGCFISVTDRWVAGGKEGAAANEQVYTYDKDGTYTVSLEESIVAGGSPLPRNSPLAFRTSLLAEVDIPVQGGEKKPETAASKELMNRLRKMTYCQLRLSGRIPMEWLDGRSPAKQIGGADSTFSWGGPEHPLVWTGNAFSLAFKQEQILNTVRGGPMRDKGYDETGTYDISLTGTVDPTTGTILSVRGVSTYTHAYKVINYPSKGPPTVTREVLEFRNLGPLTIENDTHITARRNDVPPDALKQYLVEMTNTATDPSFRFYLGTGDPKTCKVDLWITFGK